MSSVRLILTLLAFSMLVTLLYPASSQATPAGPSPVQHRDAPAWSPDGRWIAYAVQIDGDWEIAIMDNNGSRFRRLTRSPGLDTTPAWSPDGQWIAFLSERHGGRKLFRMRTDGSEVRLLTQLSSRQARPSFSPDGKRIVFNANTEDGTREIFVAELETGVAQQVTNAPKHSDWAWWSTDDDLIHFESDRSGQWQIYSMRPDGSSQRQITHSTQVSAAPMARSKRDLIVGHALRDSWEIVTWDARGAETNLTQHPAEDRMPAWSPDGRSVAFISDRRGPFEIFVLDIESGKTRQLTEQEPGAVDVVRVLRDEGVAAATDVYEQLRARFPARAVYDERAANSLGYELLTAGKIQSAVEVFRFNAAAFPDSGNAFDSLGEAQRAGGDTAGAIDSYRRSLELAPGNDNARRVLGELLADRQWPIPHDSADWVPAYSPDGRWIAYASTPEGADATEIVMIAANGKGWRRLTHSLGRDERPRWSPDGQRIAFNSDRDGNWNIYVLDLASGEQHRLTEHPGQDQRPDFSPDGQHLLFDSDRSGDVELYEMALDQPGEALRLTDSPGRDAYGAYSPDGTHIALTSARDGDAEIFVVQRDGSAPQQLTHNEATDQAPRWSPDGGSIVFFSERDDDHEIYRMARDGSQQRRLTISPGWDFMPDWSPDGTTLVFDSRRSGRRALFLMQADGSRQRSLTQRQPSPFVKALEAGDSVALATVQLTPELPPALETELASATARALANADGDLAFRLAALWLRSYPYTTARSRWVHRDLETVYPLLETRAQTSSAGLALQALASAKLEHAQATELLERAAQSAAKDPLVDEMRAAWTAESIARTAFEEDRGDTLLERLRQECERRSLTLGTLAERRLNSLGYELLNADRTEEALAVLGAIADLFPQSSNAFDSFGEALWRAGRTLEAIASYERALLLDSSNGNARRMIQRIQAEARGPS